jgi:hypothetical protein
MAGGEGAAEFEAAGVPDPDTVLTSAGSSPPGTNCAEPYISAEKRTCQGAPLKMCKEENGTL